MQKHTTYGIKVKKSTTRWRSVGSHGITAWLSLNGMMMQSPAFAVTCTNPSFLRLSASVGPWLSPSAPRL